MGAKIVAARKTAIEDAARLLREGRLVAFPTETVYGLAGDATNERAVAGIFAAKGRPRFNPLIVHVSGLPEAQALAVFDERAHQAACRFWPGPLTLVLPRRAHSGLSLLVSAGLDTVALRAPAHPVARELLRAAALPVAAPSANRSGRVSPTRAGHVSTEFGRRVQMILDGGACPVGIESSVIDLTGPIPVLLRPGGVTLESLSEIFGAIESTPAEDGALRSPGRLPSHYAPSLPLRLEATAARPDEALLAFGPDAPSGFSETLWLSRTDDLAEAAANLFAMLRQLDRPGLAGIAVMPIPDRGLGRAINDRLRRAAAPRGGLPKGDRATRVRAPRGSR
jgi:L-threonylcarbamoyladenylate synthase